VGGNLYTRRMEEAYSTIFRQCVSLNTELHKLVPLAKQMHLLSSNAVSSAARAGSEGDAFRVLTQDIQLLGDDVSACIDDTQSIIDEIVRLASNLARLFSNYIIYINLKTRLEDDRSAHSLATKTTFFDGGQRLVAEEIKDNNHKMSRSLNKLTLLLSPISALVKKGEYLAVCSSVEAASAGEHGVSFEAVSSMLRELVGQLGEQSSRQKALLRDLSDSIDQQQQNQGKLFYAR